MLISDILGKFRAVSEMPDGYLARCPGHEDGRPSLRIWIGDDRKVRMQCRAGCPTESVIKAAGLRWHDMFDAQGDGVTVPAQRPEMVTAAEIGALALYVDQAAALYSSRDDVRTYAEKRFGVTPDVARELCLGASGPTFRYLSDTYRRYPRLVVPLTDFRGRTVGLQGRDVSGRCPVRWVSLSNPPGMRWSPYGVLPGGGGEGPVVITEGPSDGLTAACAGYDAVVIRGASLAGSPGLVAEIADGVRGRRVVVAGDSDDAGQEFNRRLSSGLAEHGVTVYALDIPGGDLTDWRETDPDALHRAIEEASPVESLPVALVDRDTGALVPDAAEIVRVVSVVEEISARYGASDVLHAHALVAFTDGKIKYAPGLGFFVWNGRVWERSEIRVRQTVHFMGAALMAAAAEKGEDGEGLRKVAKGFTNRRRIDDLMSELKAVPSVYVDATAFDARPDLLTFRNGTVDLRTGTLRPHDKADLLTYCVDIEYDPGATCPRWEQFLAEVFPDHPEMPEYMQRLTGYGITGRTSEQCFAVLWGEGANGKSVFTDTLTTVFQGITETTPFSTFEEKQGGGIPNDIATLRGARLVMASEGESGRAMSEGVLKRVTGKDMVSARFLRQEFFTFRPSFLLILATNHKPKFRGQDEGLWRRVKMIPFTRYFAPEERDHRLDSTLVAEAAGIVAWAVRGAVEWYRNGLQDPAAITSATVEYRETSDALAGFLPGVLVREPGAEMSGSEAFNEYLAWCEAENLPSKERWTRRSFFGAMEERGITRKTSPCGIALVGVRLADQDNAPAGPGVFGG